MVKSILESEDPEDGDFKCDRCPASFDVEADFKNHLHDVHKLVRYLHKK